MILCSHGKLHHVCWSRRGGLERCEMVKNSQRTTISSSFFSALLCSALPLESIAPSRYSSYPSTLVPPVSLLSISSLYLVQQGKDLFLPFDLFCPAKLQGRRCGEDFKRSPFFEIYSIISKFWSICNFVQRNFHKSPELPGVKISIWQFIFVFNFSKFEMYVQQFVNLDQISWFALQVGGFTEEHETTRGWAEYPVKQGHSLLGHASLLVGDRGGS